MKHSALALIAAFSYCTVLVAAPVDKHIRGRIESVNPGALVIRTSSGSVVAVALSPRTHYLQVVRSNLNRVEPGCYIGTATKNIGRMEVALELMIFPADMRGLNAGHFPYDQLPDTTLSGDASTPSVMTNGSVAAVMKPAHALVSTTMTNGNLTGTESRDGVEQLTITYKGGRQTIVVPPTAPIVELRHESLLAITKGAFVFVDATDEGNSLRANLVAAGVGGLKPPF